MYIAGVDEVGRGPLAGDVIAAAVILDKPIEGLTDSKKLSHRKRLSLFDQIVTHAKSYAFGRASVMEIDTMNIHHATLLAMKRAVTNLTIMPNRILVDGLYCPQVAIPCEAIIKGDLTVPEISAASILAKVTRDHEMTAFDKIYPGYGFGDNKGYPTEAHRAALKVLGPCEIHRRSFGPIRAILES